MPTKKNTERIVVMAPKGTRKRLEAAEREFYEHVPATFADVARAALVLGLDQLEATPIPRTSAYVAPPKAAWTATRRAPIRKRAARS